MKAPRYITHELGLRYCGEALKRFLDGTSGLEEKLGPLLFQFPPKLELHRSGGEAFFYPVAQLIFRPIPRAPQRRTCLQDGGPCLLPAAWKPSYVLFQLRDTGAYRARARFVRWAPRIDEKRGASSTIRRYATANALEMLEHLAAPR